jgi:hypothetical protein
MFHAVNVTHFSAVSRVFDMVSLLPDGFKMSQLPLLGVVEQVMAKASTSEYQDRPSLLYKVSTAVRTCRSIKAAPC